MPALGRRDRLRSTPPAGHRLRERVAAMLSLQRLLSKSDKFYDLLEKSADEAHRSVHALVDMLNQATTAQSLDEFILRRRQNKRINEDMTALLCATFVTPLEREDIEELSRALYKIPKTIEKFCERLVLSKAYLREGLFLKQVKLLEQATDTVCQMVRQLRLGSHLDKTKEENDRLHYYEGEADKLMNDLLRDLYSGQYEALQVVVLRDLYELLEKVIDRCRDAGNVVFQIVLKNS
jgi:uncharacterized protein